MAQVTTIGIFVFDDSEELDWVGPLEVFGVWARYWPDDSVEVFTLARADGPIRCANGLQVLPDHTWATAPPLDVLVYPGGAGTRHHLSDAEIQAWLRAQAEAGVLMTSVCTGSLVLAAAGLLDGRPAATHWRTVDLLSGLGEDIEVRRDDRFVDAGPVVTAAGVSAGIDMALHLVARLHSVDRAAQVRRGIQYDPAPPV